jgi:hypothetical protein
MNSLGCLTFGVAPHRIDVHDQAGDQAIAEHPEMRGLDM